MRNNRCTQFDLLHYRFGYNETNYQSDGIDINWFYRVHWRPAVRSLEYLFHAHPPKMSSGLTT